MPESKGGQAIEGALTRMDENENNGCDVDYTDSHSFGQWGDWDNGHTDSK